MLRTECELDEKVPPSPPETLVQGLGPLDSPLSIGFEAQCMSHVAMACPACLHTLMLRHDCTHRTCLEIDVLMHSDESQEGLEGNFSSRNPKPTLPLPSPYYKPHPTLAPSLPSSQLDPHPTLVLPPPSP